MAAPAGRTRAWRLAALAWLVFVAVVVVHQVQFWRAPAIDTDVLALLPEDEHAPEVSEATRRLADNASRQVIVLLGAADWATARAAAGAWRAAMARDPAATALTPSTGMDARALGRSVEFYRPWRDRLLTPEQRLRLSTEPTDRWVQGAMAALYQPAAGGRLSDWTADPLSLWAPWWSERAADSRLRPRDGELALSAEGREWIALPYEVKGSAFALDGEPVLGGLLGAGERAARAVAPDLLVLRAGVPLHAEAAAVQASREINTIGWGSLAAVLLLVWLAFRSLRPITLVALSLVVGVASALSVTAWFFGEVHLITLVFGASLVGVAEDYGIHYFASRQGHPEVAPRTMMRQLLPGLLLALATSVVAYLRPLPPEASVAALTLLGQSPIEVFGSSETGGIAWRQRARHADHWTALPGVRWRVEADGLLAVQSAHLPDEAWYVTADRVEADAAGGFLLRGRADRIVKIEEKRVSLTAMEHALIASGLLVEARVVELPDASSSRLGVVAVPNDAGRAILSEGKRALTDRLRALLLQRVERIALPRRFRFVDRLPANAQGKTPMAALQALFRPVRPAAEWVSRDAERAVARLDVAADLLVFDGHFPGTPVLPGVAQVDWAVRFAAECFPLPQRMLRLDALKFQRPVRPGAQLELSLHWRAADRVLGFVYASEAGTHAGGSVVFRPDGHD